MLRQFVSLALTAQSTAHVLGTRSFTGVTDADHVFDAFLLRSGIVDPDKSRPYPSPNISDLLPLSFSSNGSIPTLESLAVPTNMSQITVASSTNNLTRRADPFWMETITHGQMPFGSSNYKFFRNVKDYGAKGDGMTDDTDAINKAVTDGNRCGQACGSTTISEALVYFPSGTYLISKPIIQYYATQFVGNPLDRPTIKGSADFAGIALIDSDPYIPGGNGDEWYVNQNQFYRQIRNFVLDMRTMQDIQVDPNTHFATFNATGIHWQVAQATSLQYIDFLMPVSDTSHAIGIFMENGSGGFVSDLVFQGGNIGFRAGSQQFTARNLHFSQVHTAISMVWDWGFTWKSLIVEGCYIAIDCTSFGGPGAQGTGSIAVLDSSFTNVQWAITIPDSGFKPSILIDNLGLINVPNVVVTNSRSPILTTSGTQTIQSWAQGPVYQPGATNTDGGNLPVPSKPANMLDNHGHWLELSRPHYGNDPPTVVATANGIANDGTGDQSDAINTFLRNNVGKVIFFPAGVYLVQKTVFIPVGSRIVGEGWSQIMGTGPAFNDVTRPTPIVRVGNPGDSGIIELSDLLFTVKGANPGAVLLEWNVKESSQGSAAMWDCHFRVGGAINSNLQLADCPTSQGKNPKTSCQAAAMLMHVTPQASGYFENVWAWVADHDLDHGGDADAALVQISVYVGRGVLIESTGPSWWYGTASEHSQMYQYQLLGARNVFMGHMQTETPYYQPSPLADTPYKLGRFNCDPSFAACTSSSDANCKEAWALRILGSEDIYIYSAGFYSFFQNYKQDCVKTESCQDRLVMTSGNSRLWIYNLFTKGAVDAISPSAAPPIHASDVQNGFTTEITAWLLGSQGGGTTSIGSSYCASQPAYCRPKSVAALWKRDEL